MTTIATVYVQDERYATMRPDHVHRKCVSHEEAQRWIDLAVAYLGKAEREPEIFDWDFSYRCPKCGWAV